MRFYNPRMRILIANDDGYLAPGISALVEACEGLGTRTLCEDPGETVAIVLELDATAAKGILD